MSNIIKRNNSTWRQRPRRVFLNEILSDMIKLDTNIDYNSDIDYRLMWAG